ncbi:peptidase C14 caspase catalytic subunit p20 [Calothrix sp. NIES-4071]|nr:peptidase C14 caspase catalytic subunit p20 [Calothrix sp. NIES-4071]BAZ56622.1 peptidase C14 caspase catalytic subunit p20 [Calothrix sp. NIES-4105]
MANNWAIAIGINQYQFLQPLACAEADAKAVRAFLIEDGAFKQQQCLLMSDTSPPIGDRPTTPTKENILLLLEDLIAACWRPQDRVWFFFSGYGVNHNGRDYLMPIDGTPERIEETGIEVAALMQSLQVSGVNLLMLLDINRAFGTLNEIYVGQEIIDLAQELQLPLILSCQPEQFSYESNELGHGFFSAALLEALRSGNGNTLGELEAYLSIRTPELCQHFWRPTQNPVTVITSSKQVILGNFELENDDAPAIVVSEEIFASALSAPMLESATNKNNPHLAQPPSNYYSQLHNVQNVQNVQNGENVKNQVVTTSESEFAREYINSSVQSTIPEPSIKRSLPASLPPARPGVVEEKASSIETPHDHQELEQAPGASVPFWLQVLLWGGSMTLLLGMIVLLLFRNQSGVVEQNNSTSANVTTDDTSLVRTAPDNSVARTPGVSEAPVTQPTIQPTPPPITPTQATTTATPETTPKPQAVTPVAITNPQIRKQALAELDRLSLTPTQATDLKIAIATARKIKPSDQQYPQAQANIQVWNSMIFDLAQERAKKRQYSSAVAAAQLIGENEALYPKADSAVTQWRQQAKQYVSNKTVVEAATALVKPGQASSYNRAIEVAKKVPKGEPGFDIAQKSIDKWSKEILNLAKKRAAKGDKQAAVSTATLVPQGTPAYSAAYRAIQQWKK